MEWFGLNGGHIAASLKVIGNNQENKNPAGYWSGRGSRKIDDLNQIVNYLPASLVRELSAKLNLSLPVPDSRLYRLSSMHTNMPMPGDHWVGCGCMGWSMVDCITC